MLQGRLDTLLADRYPHRIARRARRQRELCHPLRGGFVLALTALRDGEEVLLHAPVQFAHPDDPAGQFRRCLESSLDGGRSQGAAVGLDPDGWITLWRRLPLEGVDGHGLEGEIVGFATAADALRADLAPGQVGGTTCAAFPPGTGDGVFKA
ncbi:MAG: CesT family type III secretion system chaperone [Gammaproteobacteria bacterium]